MYIIPEIHYKPKAWSSKTEKKYWKPERENPWLPPGPVAFGETMQAAWLVQLRGSWWVSQPICSLSPEREQVALIAWSQPVARYQVTILIQPLKVQQRVGTTFGLKNGSGVEETEWKISTTHESWSSAHLYIPGGSRKEVGLQTTGRVSKGNHSISKWWWIWICPSKWFPVELCVRYF